MQILRRADVGSRRANPAPRDGRISPSNWRCHGEEPQVWYTLLADGIPYFSDLIGYRATTVLYLSPSTTYGFRLSARDAYGNTAQSNLLSVTTSPTTDIVAPTVPTNLRFSSESSPPEAWLTWDQSTDDTDPQSQILYEVYVNGTRADESTAIGYSSTIAYCRAEGPTTFVVRAFDTSGNMSLPSNELVLMC